MKTFSALGRKLVSPLLTRLLWTAVLVLPAIEAQTSVVLTSLYSFIGTNDGTNPQAGLVQGSDGFYYGTTYDGGTNDDGTVFKISANGTFSNLCSFGGANGRLPYARLVEGRDGYFYGTTYKGGTDGDFGTIFKVSTNGALTNLHAFDGIYGDGAFVIAGLVLGSDGNFYGTAGYGGTNGGLGTVFAISPNGTFASLYSFDGTNGEFPLADLVQGADGNFYGTTYEGGTNGGFGTVFRITTNGALTSLYSFGGNDGANPQAGLVQGSDGYLYGTTSAGGTNDNLGTVFKISANGTFSNLCSFGGANGELPFASLVEGRDGYFYGTTGYGGTNGGFGTVFEITTNGALTSLYSFSRNDGAHPFSVLVQRSVGRFYGTTFAGGKGEAGTVFRLTIVPAFQAVTLAANTLSLTWSTEAGGMYQLQCNSNLISSNWTNLGNALAATGTALSATNSITNGPQQFYRVVLLP